MQGEGSHNFDDLECGHSKAPRPTHGSQQARGALVPVIVVWGLCKRLCAPCDDCLQISHMDSIRDRCTGYEQEISQLRCAGRVQSEASPRGGHGADWPTYLEGLELPRSTD